MTRRNIHEYRLSYLMRRSHTPAAVKDGGRSIIMLKQNQTDDTDRDEDAVIELGAASEVTLATGNFSVEPNLEPRIWKD